MEGAEAGQAASVYQNGDLKIDFATGCTYVEDTKIHLTPIEYKLLCLLSQNTGKVLTHHHILSETWGNALASDAPSLRVFMATLRKKVETSPLSPRYIQTHIGVGVPHDPPIAKLYAAAPQSLHDLNTKRKMLRARSREV